MVVIRQTCVINEYLPKLYLKLTYVRVLSVYPLL